MANKQGLSGRKPTATLTLVDSCGWLEYVTGGANADFFEAALLDTGNLIVPALRLDEVGKRMLITQGEVAALEVLEMMQKSRMVQLAQDDYFAAAKTSAAHQLMKADALIRQTAQAFGATLCTQDSELKAMNGVKFQSRWLNECYVFSSCLRTLLLTCSPKSPLF